MDYQMNGQQPPQQPQFQYNQMQFNQQQQQQQQHPPQQFQQNQQFQPQNQYYQQQQMYPNQQQMGQFMMPLPQQMGMMPQHLSQPSAQAEHNLILEQVLSKNEEKSKNIIQTKNACPLHPTTNSKSCRTCRKIASEYELKSQEMKDQEKKEKLDDDCDGDLLENLPAAEKGENNIFKIWEYDSSGSLNSKLRTNIMNSNYFRIDLFSLKTYHEVIDEIQKHVNHAQPWAIGSTGVPSTLFCCLYKFMLMKLTVKQVKGLVEYKLSPMVRAVGFLYIRFCCDPKYMFAWFKKHLLDDEEFKPGSDKNSPQMTIGDYVEKLLSDQEYFGTRLPRIPIKIETKIKAKLILNQEKRERKKRNLQNIGNFIRELPVIAISSVDNEWHEGILEKVEGKLVQVRFLPDASQTFEGGNELVNLGEIELGTNDEQSGSRNKDKPEQSTRQTKRSQSRSVSQERKRKSRSRSKSNKRKRSRSKDKKKKHSSRSRSNDRKKKYKRSRTRSRDRKHRRSRSRSEKTVKSKIESMKEREQKLVEEIKKRQADQAVAYSKSDVARIPQSYKTALSGNVSKIAQSGRSPSSGRREEFVETIIPSVAENRQKKQQESEKQPQKQKTQEQKEKELKMLQMYGGDAQTKGSAYTQNRQASDYA